WIAPPTTTSTTTDSKTVLLFGWLNGDFKHVEKYAHYYRANGYTAVVQTSTDADQSAIARKQMDKSPDFDDLISWLHSRHATEPISNPTTNISHKHNLVIHVFSNGGIFRLRRLVAAVLAKGFQFVESRAVILDSAPGKATAEAFAGLVSTGFKRGSTLRSCAYWGAYIVGGVYSGVVDLSGHPVETSALFITSVRNQGVDGNVRGPRLFLYGDRDDVISWTYCQGWAERSRSEGLRVEERLFEGGEHVKLGVQFKEEYWATVSSYLESQG
ncbi:hypothetical protein BCR33DRAFT_720438, partial [Rhizoclosmatium globosum]